MHEDELENMWQRFGGDAVMGPLIDQFYDLIADGPIAHLFPPDLDETRSKQFAFQSEFWGGPARYTPKRGPPRMRMRHLPFRIRPDDAKVWLATMEAAVSASQMPTDMRPIFLKKLAQVAQAMVNTYD